MASNDTTIILLFASVAFCILNCFVLLNSVSSLKNKVSELEKLVVRKDD